MEDLEVAEIKRNEKNGAPKTAVKKLQQQPQRKKVRQSWLSVIMQDGKVHTVTDRNCRAGWYRCRKRGQPW
jgi:hypothetical protein